MPTVTVDAASAGYGNKTALADVSMELEGGMSLAVIGPNGSGKSTLLKLVAGLLKPSLGRVEVHGNQVAMVAQSTEVARPVPITVRDVVSMARYPHLGLFRPFRSTDSQAVDEVLDRMDLKPLAKRHLHELSGGQRQRALVGQALAQKAPILLLDEPVNGLDVTSRSIISQVISDEVEAGTTVVITTHSFEEAMRSDRVLLINTSPVAFGTPDEVLVEDHLRTAFGGGFLKVDGKLILDDPIIPTMAILDTSQPDDDRSWPGRNKQPT